MTRKGTYVLEARLDSDKALGVGALGEILFPAGTYCYAGSAMGGLDARIGRHMSRDKKARWHIDRLTLAADLLRAYESSVPECLLAEILREAGGEPFAPGFGCSDCRCATHLFRMGGGSMAALAADPRLKARADAPGPAQPL
ncbi:MAG: GIY-YIG nuclease family protein [Candidatus Methanoplasma sp.]|jgi:Uri superfamily endonuclease|nr:GIY-YIG nuclease family protein [Candidatus Methanoplasma sp.]